MPARLGVVFHVRLEKKGGIAELAAEQFVKFESLFHVLSNKGQLFPYKHDEERQ